MPLKKWNHKMFYCFAETQELLAQSKTFIPIRVSEIAGLNLCSCIVLLSPQTFMAVECKRLLPGMGKLICECYKKNLLHIYTVARSRPKEGCKNLSCIVTDTFYQQYPSIHSLEKPVARVYLSTAL